MFTYDYQPELNTAATMQTWPNITIIMDNVRHPLRQLISYLEDLLDKTMLKLRRSEKQYTDEAIKLPKVPL